MSVLKRREQRPARGLQTRQREEASRFANATEMLIASASLALARLVLW